ncbi:MAG: TonB-dependent receptor [Prevotella sp.]|nr:TonB-dependent receptor [Prevotella sp.]
MNTNIKRAFAALLMLMVCFVANAQKTVTGNVKDATGEPMIGVSVIVDGTTIGGVTDLNGNFTIQKVPNNGVLKVSYVGYKEQKLPVGSKTSFNIVLQEDAMGLDEVVVVGYGTMKKKDLTGSVASVKTDDIQKVAGANVMEAMQAKIPGVDIQTSDGQAGSGISLQLRGNRSLLASNTPLVIVDGVEYGTTLDIPATDIESMDILKDAASTAIYGTKGANGVILITTKRGKAGRTSVNFNGYVSFNGLTGVVKPMYGDKEVQRLIDKKNYEDAAANGWVFTNAATPADVLTYNLEDGTPTLDIYNDKSYTDWLDMILQNSVSQNYEVSVQGGDAKTNFNMSLAMMDDQGMLKDDVFKRYTGRSNIDHQINRMLKVGTSISYAYRSTDRRDGGVYGQAQKMTTITHPYNADGSINERPNPWYTSHVSPLLDEDGAYQRNIEFTRFFGSAYAQLNPIKGMMLKSQFTLDRSDTRTGTYSDYQSRGQYQNNQQSSITNAKSVTTKYVWQNTANYDLTLAEKHDLTFLLGHEMSQYVTESSNITGASGFEHYYTGAFYDVTKIAAPQVSSGYTKGSMLSYFARVNYSYEGKYLLQASLRADGSSVLAEGHKWGYFPSISAGWRITEENFMKGTQSWLDNLKLRVSWGLSGNSAISEYQTLATISSIVPNSTDKAPMTMANPNLTWEKTAALDFGLDFSFLNGLIYGSIDYYKSNTYDLLYYKTAPPSSVFTSTISNVGKTRGHGLELALGAAPIRTKDVQWDINASATFARDYVDELADGLEQFVNGTSILKIDEPVSAFYAYDIDGMWGIGEFDQYMAAHPNFVKPQADYGDPGTPKVIDSNGDDKIDDSDKVIYSRSPKAILGLGTSVSYKDFTLSLQTMARLGGYISYSGYSLYLYDNANWGDLSYWTPDNQDADIPSPGANGATPTTYKDHIQIQKGDYFKIKDITLSYNLPKPLLKKVYISNARVYCSMKNYFTFSHFDNYDPERGGAVNFPMRKQVVVGLNLTF